jgi:hypothetical protein
MRTIHRGNRAEPAKLPISGVVGVALCIAGLTIVVSPSARPNENLVERPIAAVPPPPMALARAEPVVPVAGAHFVRTFDVSCFRRGNLHAHSNRSDGDSDPLEVYAWYKDHGYDFVALTDHNMFTNPAEFRSIEGPGFIVIGGEEVTMRGAGRPVHINALCTDHSLPGGKYATASEALARGVTAIREAGGVALINHPNFNWGIMPTDLPAAHGAQLLEIQSGHPFVRTLGNMSHPSHEMLWDMALTAGLDFMGAAVDDTHHLHKSGFRLLSYPGHGWVEVFAATLDEATICRALDQGMFYSSTGPSLLRISVTDDTYSIWPAEADVEVQFIGMGGKRLAAQKLGRGEAFASYKMLGSEGYVRARVSSGEDKTAWTPAVRVRGGSGQAEMRVASPDQRPPG